MHLKPPLLLVATLNLFSDQLKLKCWNGHGNKYRGGLHQKLQESRESKRSKRLVDVPDRHHRVPAAKGKAGRKGLRSQLRLTEELWHPQQTSAGSIRQALEAEFSGNNVVFSGGSRSLLLSFKC